MGDTLQKKIDEWLRIDKNETTLREVNQLLSNGDIKELRQRMDKRIAFGTAGLRGRMEAGWSRMNDLTIIQASQGLCAYVQRIVHDASEKGVVIGHDHRHNSERWADLTAMVFVRAGFKVYLHRGLVHTPLVPFTISRLKTACGVMITASHNPKHDNGYKVYWENGVQIIDPHDTGISESINKNLVPVSWDTEILKSPLCLDVTGVITDAYMEYLSSLRSVQTYNPAVSLQFVNTSMHGVSHKFVVNAFEVFGLAPFLPVKAQQDPDPEFPTVAFPNPEEKGALDLSLQEADAAGVKYVLAQDPDADRFAAAEKGPDGKWVTFTGDQLGIIFAARCLEQYRSTGKSLEKLAMVASTVSSKMIESMAIKEGFLFRECLTGFKYIGNTALQLEKEGYEVLFGYEEAIGYMIGSTIRDKDGVAATVCFAELASGLEAKGSTVASFLQDLYQKYGYFKTANSYFICNDATILSKIFTRLRAFHQSPDISQPSYPSVIANLNITSVVDLTVGYDSTNPPTFKPSLPLSSGQMIQFRAQSPDEDVKITLTLRTSGTEPKLKFYLEGSGRDLDRIDEALSGVVAELRDKWIEARKNQLALP